MARAARGVTTSSYSSGALTSAERAPRQRHERLAASVGGIRFADVRQGLGIAEDRQALLEFGEIRGAQQHCRLATVPRDHDPIVLTLDTIDDL